jgi:biopolymer transport protein ExbB
MNKPRLSYLTAIYSRRPGPRLALRVPHLRRCRVPRARNPDRGPISLRGIGRIQRERRALENGLTLLASIANIAPFIGLFGTVFGIIHALHAVASGASGGIEGVAGPVGQALVATGIGIAVAIPAVIAYNLLLRRQRVTIADLEDYAADLVNLAQRNGFRIKSVIPAPASSAMPSPEQEVSA